jgi:HSP20 family protein
MVLVRWNPYQEMNSLQRQIDRIFDNMLAPVNLRDFHDFSQVPVAELSETEDVIYLKLEVSGIKASDLDIQVSRDSIYVSGERTKEFLADEKSVTRSEFHYGKFQRIIPLPAKIQNTNVKAEYKNGILNLTLPKAESEKNKVVKVNLQKADT